MRVEWFQRGRRSLHRLNLKAAPDSRGMRWLRLYRTHKRMFKLLVTSQWLWVHKQVPMTAGRGERFQRLIRSRARRDASLLALIHCVKTEVLGEKELGNILGFRAGWIGGCWGCWDARYAWLCQAVERILSSLQKYLRKQSLPFQFWSL